MARVILRQTFIALRARRLGYRVAADFLYDVPIDVQSFACARCGRNLAGQPMTLDGRVVCPACRSDNRAPQHVRSLCRSKVSRHVGPEFSPKVWPEDEPEPWSVWELRPAIPVLTCIFLLTMIVAGLLILLATAQK